MREPKLRLNLPEGWKLDFSLRQPTFEDDDCYETEVYQLTTAVDGPLIHVYMLNYQGAAQGCMALDLAEADAVELLEPRLADGKDAREFIKPFRAGDIKGHYFAQYLPEEGGLSVLCAYLDLPGWRDVVRVDAYYRDPGDGSGEARAVEALRGLLAKD